MSESRKLAAILVADIVGYSRLAGVDEERTLARLRGLRSDLIDPAIAAHHGRIVKRTGDGSIIEFRSVVDAVRCAIEVQTGMVERNAGLPPERRIEFRVGVHLGDVVEESDGDLMGDGVNIAARLEGVCEPGGVCLSGAAYDQVRDRVTETFVDLGEKPLKNIARPVRIYGFALDRRPPESESPAFETPPLALPDKPSIAILPFQNMSGDAEQEYFADGIVEDIITAVSRLRGFFVIARNSTFTYKGKLADVRQIARELGVQYVLEGSVRRAGQRLRITAQLIDASTGNHIWADRYDRAVKDVFDVQDEIVEGIVASIEPQLYESENLRTGIAPPDSLDAWGCVTRALWHFGRLAPDDNDRARDILDRAVALSPNYAKAHSLLAFASVRRVWFGTCLHEVCVPIARKHANTALRLDDRDSWTYFADAMVKCLERKFAESIAACEAAIALNGNFAMAHGYMALTLAMCGQTQAALLAVERAMRMSPRDPYNAAYLHFAAISHFATEQYREAIELDRRALVERPNFVVVLRFLSASHAMLDEMEQAREAIADLLRLQPNCSIRYINSLPHYAHQKDQDRLIGALRKAGLPD